MDTIKMIITAACFTGIAISVADMLKPSEKFNKQIRLIFSLIFISGIITPLMTNGFHFSISDADAAVSDAQDNSVSETFDDQLKQIIENNIADSLSEKLNESGIKCNEIQVNINIDEHSGISINEVAVDCDNTEKAIQIIASLLSISEECINSTDK